MCDYEEDLEEWLRWRAIAPQTETVDLEIPAVAIDPLGTAGEPKPRRPKALAHLR